LAFLIEISSTNLFSGSGVSLYKMITSPPRNQYLIMKAKINPTFRAYRNVSISWSCSECTQNFRPYLTGDLLYLPSSLVSTVNKMTLSANVTNWMQTSQSSNTLTLDLSQTNVPNIDLTNSLNDQSMLECYGFAIG